MTLSQLRRQVCEANLQLVREGLVTLTWGNVSGLDRARGLVVIKPSGVAYARLTPARMAVVALADGRVQDGGLRPSSDTPTHLALYRAFPAVGGIAHTHSRHATAFAQASRPIPCLGTTHADQFHGPVPLARALTPGEVADDYEGNTGRVIAARFAKLDPLAVPAVLAAHHGPFTWGRDALDAVHNSIVLEAVAAMALATLQLNPRIGALPAHILEKHYSRKHGPAAYYGQAGKR